jgi:predicted metalloprotease with PDZ domain
MLARRGAGERVVVHAFRRDELMQFEVDLTDPPAQEVKLSLQTRPTAVARVLRKGWLGVAAG